MIPTGTRSSSISTSESGLIEELNGNTRFIIIGLDDADDRLPNHWDWQKTFEGYYTTAWNNFGVRGILDSVTIFEGATTPDTEFTFSHAEVGFLRQYLDDNPEKGAALQSAGSRFCLLGGGITSPDNQACHGEVFIRNYLTGHEYLRSVGLIDNVFFVAWLPDDFGHDPQLPVLIEALGMSSIALSRIPGSPQPGLCPAQQPANNFIRANGLSFYWPGNDGSKMLTHFMPQTYYGITNGLKNLQMKTAQSFEADRALWTMRVPVTLRETRIGDA